MRYQRQVGESWSLSDAQQPAARGLALISALLIAACGNTSATGPTGDGPGGSTGGSGTGGKDLGCLDGNQNIDCTARIEVKDSSGLSKADKTTVTVPVSSIKTGEFVEVKLIVTNVANPQAASELRLLKVSLEYSAKSPLETENAFMCLGADGVTPCDKVVWRTIVPGGAVKAGAVTQEEIIIRYKRYDDQARSANLWLEVAGDESFFSREFLLKLDTKSGAARIVIPELVEFGQVPPDTSVCKEFKVTNSGDAVLEIKKIEFFADSVFSLETKLNDGTAKVYKPGELVQFEPALTVASQASHDMKVCFAPKDPNKKQGSLTFVSNDPKPMKEGVVQILANAKVPCMQLEPAGKLSFGGVKLGEPAVREVKIKACGGADLIVDKIDFGDAGNSNEFTLKFDKTAAKFPSVDPKSGPTKTGQLVVPVNGEAVFEVVYTPEDESPKDPDTNEPMQDTAEIKVTSNAFQAKNSILAEGIGVVSTCPSAKISIKEGEEVVPQTVLHLKGDGSTGSGGAAIKTYKWTAKQPGGSTQVFLPGSNFPNPTFTANAAGEYVFCLEVTDANNQKSCAPACVTVLVIPEEAIHVELLWNTPADPDQSDSGPAAGADMDLHFAHYLAGGLDIDCDGKKDPWFANPFDTFWFNHNPNWGSASPTADDDPSLDLDDTDGAGPENLNLAHPEGSIKKAAFYHVGVHYWNDHGFGSSQAQVNVYIFGVLAVQITGVTMDPLDMWYVGKIHWPNKITDKAAANVEPVELCYQTGDPCKGGKRWVPQGDHCITKCYYNPGFVANQSGGANPQNCKK